jgi:hypothetical protein
LTVLGNVFMVFLLVLIFVGAFANAALGSLAWIPVAIVLAFGALVALRAIRIRFLVDDDGMTIANFFRRRRFAWSEIAKIDEGRVRWTVATALQDSTSPSLRVWPKRGRPIAVHGSVGVGANDVQRIEGLAHGHGVSWAVPRDFGPEPRRDLWTLISARVGRDNSGR